MIDKFTKMKVDVQVAFLEMNLITYSNNSNKIL